MSPEIAEVLAEMRRARDKHGAGWMGNLSLIQKDTDTQRTMRESLEEALFCARTICDSDEPTRIAVLVEEVCELALGVRCVPFPRDELVQVAAMALAWLGVDPDAEPLTERGLSPELSRIATLFDEVSDDVEQITTAWVDAEGRVYEARKALGENYMTLRDGHRVKSPSLPVRTTLEDAQADLDTYADVKGFNRLVGQIPGGGGSR